MIALNRLLLIVLGFVLLTFESVFALPILSLFMFFKLIDRLDAQDERSFYLLCLALGMAALAVALFYQLSIGLTLILFFTYYFARSRFGTQMFGQSRHQWQLLQLVLFILLQLSIFALSGLNFNLFIFLQVVFSLIWLTLKSSTWRKL